MELWLAVTFALAFAFTNGLHDAANAIATLVATRGAGPGPAIALSAAFNLLGALLVGTAVADTIAGIVTVDLADAVAAIGAGVCSRGLNLLTGGAPAVEPGAALVGGLSARRRAAGSTRPLGRLDGWPVGLRVLIASRLARFAHFRRRGDPPQPAGCAARRPVGGR
jgi:PiT family inorganic phosphate transporter